MIMKRLVNLLFFIAIFLFVGCEDEKADNDNMSVKEVTTDNVNDGPYYFNFVSGKKDSIAWHLSYQNLPAGGGNYMPSFALNGTLMLAIDNSKEFDAIQTSPASSLFAPEGGRMQYGGSNGVLTYDMITHKVSTSNDNYIIYDTISHKVYKIHFDEYSGGVVLFRYGELDGQ
tara:strand:- start:78 stop:593 length:516 start_codon:yes stop_codon:yes gene_type:complete